MKLKVNIHEFIEENASTYNGQLQVSANIDLDDILSNIPEEDEIDVDIHDLLAENRQIAHVWGTDDVRELRPDLDDDRAWEVLQDVQRQLSSDVGITWDVIQTIAAELYPQPEGPWQGRIEVSVENYTRDAAVEHFEGMARLMERQSVNSTMQAVFVPESLRLVERDATTNQSEGL
jgi:hypothetical protein